MKKLILLLCLSFLTGCSVQYRINFVDNKIEEKIDVISADRLEYDAIHNGEFAPVPSFYNSIENLEAPVKNEGVEYYDIEAKDNNIYLKYGFDPSNYQNSYMANNCFEYFKVFEEENEIVIATKDFIPSLSSYGIDKLDVVITSNHEVLYNNADEVNGDEYIWHITEDNQDEANIQISFSKEVKNSFFQKFKGSWLNILLVLVSAGSIILVISLLLFIRYKRVNKI